MWSTLEGPSQDDRHSDLHLAAHFTVADRSIRVMRDLGMQDGGERGQAAAFNQKKDVEEYSMKKPKLIAMCAFALAVFVSPVVAYAQPVCAYPAQWVWRGYWNCEYPVSAYYPPPYYYPYYVYPYARFGGFVGRPVFRGGGHFGGGFRGGVGHAGGGFRSGGGHFGGHRGGHR
jgi:uncharacterized membrane protein YgcG